MSKLFENRLLTIFLRIPISMTLWLIRLADDLENVPYMKDYIRTHNGQSNGALNRYRSTYAMCY